MPTLLQQEGALLLEPGRQAECERFITQLQESLTTLVEHLQSAGVVSVQMELQQEGLYAGGKLNGSIDLLATRADGRGGGGRYQVGRQEIPPRGAAGRTATCSWPPTPSCGATTAQALSPALSYFIVMDAHMLSLDHAFFPNAEILKPEGEENAAQYWQRFEQTWRWRKAQFDQGLVEVTVTDTEPTDGIPAGRGRPAPARGQRQLQRLPRAHRLGGERMSASHPLHQRRRRQRQDLLPHAEAGTAADHRQQVTPAGVIATTFTKLAAGELKERVRGALIEAGQLRVANQMEQALIGTVNSVCGEILRRFAFEAGMPPDQQVLDEAQGDVLFYQAMEQALADNKPLMRQMNAACHRLQIIDQQQQLNCGAGGEEDRRRRPRQQPVPRRHPPPGQGQRRCAAGAFPQSQPAATWTGCC